MDSLGRVIKKVENQYNNYSDLTLYGMVVQKFIDHVNPYGLPDANRYLISKTTHNFGVCSLAATKTTDYFYVAGSLSADSVKQEQTFTYATGNRISSSTATVNNGETLETTYLYPDAIILDATTGLTPQAAALKQMVDYTMINTPVQVTKKKGGKYVEGSYTTFKQLSNGAIVPDTLFNLNSQLETYIPNPVLDANGKIIDTEILLPIKKSLNMMRMQIR